jgi:hypothetical protein
MAASSPIPLGTVAAESQPPQPEQIDRVKERCQAAHLEFIKDPADPTLFEEWDSHFVEFPAGRETRPVFLYDSEDFDRILSIEFEKYSFLADYERWCPATTKALKRPFGS